AMLHISTSMSSQLREVAWSEPALTSRPCLSLLLKHRGAGRRLPRLSFPGSSTSVILFFGVVGSILDAVTAGQRPASTTPALPGRVGRKRSGCRPAFRMAIVARERPPQPPVTLIGLPDFSVGDHRPSLAKS